MPAWSNPTATTPSHEGDGEWSFGLTALIVGAVILFIGFVLGVTGVPKVERFGHLFGLPKTIYSGHNQLYYRATPPTTTTIGVVVGIDDPVAVRARWESCELKAELDNQLGVDNEEQNLPVHVCHGPRQPWPTLWKQFKHYN